ncbi:MAG: response regulator [Candidatus Saccharimonadales bacterium]
MAAKILLVEDDNNLREIYEARLQAEGYAIVTAQDGEEALVVAKAEKPDLIISDVMMPRISGFEMLDILRNTEELKYVKVIMLTALGQAEDKTRATSLGADRYLVKSQVTLEDIVKASHELIDGPAPSPNAPVADPETLGPPTPSPIQAPSPPTTPLPSAPDLATPPPAVPVQSPVVPIKPLAIPITPPASAQPPTPGDKPEDGLPAPPIPNNTLEAGPTNAEPTTRSTSISSTIAPTSPEAPVAPGPGESKLDTATTAEEKAVVGEQIEDFSTKMEAPASAPPLTTSQNNNEAVDDKVMIDAVHDLDANTPTKPATTTEADSAQAEPTAEEIDPVVPAPSVPTSEPDEVKAKMTVNDSVTIANKKVIQPVKSDPKPSLDELLAREEVKTSQAGGFNAKTAVVSSDPGSGKDDTKTEASALSNSQSPQPGSTFEPHDAPVVPPVSQSPSNDFDPNNIAL